MRGERKRGHLHCMGMAFRAFMQVFLVIFRRRYRWYFVQSLGHALPRTNWMDYKNY